MADQGVMRYEVRAVMSTHDVYIDFKSSSGSLKGEEQKIALPSPHKQSVADKIYEKWKSTISQH